MTSKRRVTWLFVVSVLALISKANPADLFVGDSEIKAVLDQKKLGKDWFVFCSEGDRFFLRKSEVSLSPMNPDLIKATDDPKMVSYEVDVKDCPSPILFSKGIRFGASSGKTVADAKKRNCLKATPNEESCEFQTEKIRWEVHGVVTPSLLKVTLNRNGLPAWKVEESRNLDEPSWSFVWAGQMKGKAMILLYISPKYGARRYYLLQEGSNHKISLIGDFFSSAD